MKNWLSKLFLFGVGALVIFGLAYAFVPVPELVDLAKIAPGELLVTVDEDGKTRIRERYIVSAPLSGRLLRIDLDPGDEVKAGETLLATIEPRDPELLDARTIAQAEARLKAAESAVLRAAPLTEQARLEQANAEEELGRLRNASVGGGVTESELDMAEMRYRTASEAIRSAKYAEEIAKFEAQQAEAALMRSKPLDANASLEEGANGWTFYIRSPITGRVLRTLQESSAVLIAGAPLLELGDPRDLEVEIDVLSSDAVKIRPGAKVFLEHWGGADALIGHVRLVEPAGFTKISTLGVEEQRVNVIVDLDAPPEERESLGDGFRVEARIVVADVDNALLAPTSALFRTGEEWRVFVVRDEIAHEQPVEIGQQNGLFAEVKKGLTAGDEVVVHPSDRITEGTWVQKR